MKNYGFMTLDKAEIGSVYYIRDIYGFEQKQLYRLYDYGIVEGSKIVPLFKSLIKGCVAYSVKDSVLALRNEDAHKITVSLRR